MSQEQLQRKSSKALKMALSAISWEEQSLLPEERNYGRNKSSKTTTTPATQPSQTQAVSPN